jgi:Icc-related predicted phosphoesterase
MTGGSDNLPAVDILVHSGDFTVRGTTEEVENFKAWMERLLDNGVAKHIVVVAGNHELTFEPWKAKHAVVRAKQEALKASLASVSNLHYLEDSGVEVLGLRFYGSPWTAPICGKMEWAFQMRDRDLGDQKWSAIPGEGQVDVLVTHSPPYGQGDELGHCDDMSASCPAGQEEARDGRAMLNRVTGKPAGHLGSHSLLDRVLSVRPLVHVFGHFHEGYGVSTREDIGTVFVNAAICDEDYHPDHRPILVEFVYT